MSGLRYLRSAWRRSMWNICAGVVGTQTCMLSPAQPGDLVLEEQGLDAARERAHDLLLARLHLADIELHSRRGDAVRVQVLQMRVVMRGIVQGLCLVAADVE